MAVLKKRVLLILLALVLAAGCTAAMEMIAYRIGQEEYGFNSVVFTDGSEAFGQYGSILENNTMIITGVDPQFCVSTFDQTFSKVRIKFREPVKQSTLFQLYFAPVGEWFSEANSIVRTIAEGQKQEIDYIPKGTYSMLRFDLEQSVTFDGIYIGERDWNLRPYQTDPVRMIIVFGTVFFPLCAWILFRTGKRPQGSAGKKKEAGCLIILSNLFLSLTLVFFQPLEQVLTFGRVLQIPFGNVWWVQLLLGIGIAAILSLVMRLLPKRIGIIAASVSLGLGIAFLAQSLLFNEGRVLSMDTNWPMEMLNIHVWIGIVIMTAAAGIYYSKRESRQTRIIMCIIACVLMVIQGINFTTLATIADTSVSAETQAQATEETEMLRISMERGMPFFLKPEK